MGFVKEFKEFALKGNLLEMAVAFIMGAAFGKVVTGFISGIVMPIVGQITAGVDFTKLEFVLSSEKLDETGKIVAEKVAIKYGEFITIMIDFVLVAFVVFLMVKAMNKMKKKQESEPAPAPTISEEQKLLMEIRDLLAKGK